MLTPKLFYQIVGLFQRKWLSEIDQTNVKKRGCMRMCVCVGGGGGGGV